MFLDEPMSGLDPIGRRLVRDIILDLKARRARRCSSPPTSSPTRRRLCDRVALLRGGRAAGGGPARRDPGLDVSHLEVLVSGLAAEAPATALPPVSRRGAPWESAGACEVAEEPLGAGRAARSRSAGGRVLSVQPVRQSLEDYFFKEMGAAERRTRWELAD